MDFEEVKARDRFGAYLEFNSVHSSFDMNIIPNEYKSILPERCECGSEFIISYNLKTIRCCDPHCPIKMGYAMAHMFSNYGCKNLGPETCKTIVKYLRSKDFFKVPSHLEIIGLNNENKGILDSVLGARWADLLQGIERIKRTKMSFGKMLSLASIPEFGSSSEKIFDDIRSVVDFLKINENQNLVEYLYDKGVKSPKKVTSLITNLGALTIFEYNLYFPLLAPGLRTKKVCITKSVSVDGNYMSRPKFLEFLNTKVGNVNGVQLFSFVETGGPETVDHIICDQPTNTRKYLAGKAREAAGEKNVILTAQQYVDLMREEVSAICTPKTK